MAAGVTLKHKRKAGAFTSGELAAGEVGVNTSAPRIEFSADGTTVSTVTGGGGITRTVTVTSGSFTAGSSALTDYTYLIAGAHAVALPAASGNSNRYTFKNNHSASVTITRNGTDTVEGVTSISIAPEEAVDLISNGTNAWYVI